MMVDFDEIVALAAHVAPLLMMPARDRLGWAHHALAHTSPVILVLPGRTDTQWYRAATRDGLVCHVTSRVRFPGQKGGAPFPTVLAYHGSFPRVFFDAFSPLGDIFRRVPVSRTTAEDGSR